MFTFEVIIVFIVLIFILVSLYKEILGPALTFLVAIVTLGLFGILQPKEILSGFANEQILVIIMLLLLGDVIRRAAIIEVIFNKIFKSAKSYKGFIAQMMVVVGGFSAFLNNTPLVAVMIPYLHTWSKRKNIPLSKLLIPLSYAAILGGCATLIGTSTNLIVSGLVQDQKIIKDLEPLNLFDFTYVGLPMIFIGFFYMIFIGSKILPDRKSSTTDFSNNSRNYMVEAQVRKGSSLANKSLSDSGLKNIKGLYLVEIIRDNLKFRYTSTEFILNEGDILIFAGQTDKIAELIDEDSGLNLTQAGMFVKKAHTEIVEVVISRNSSLSTKTIKEANFRVKYDAALLAIHRNGEQIPGNINSVKLREGDVLLLFAGANLVARATDLNDFYFISKIREIKKLKPIKTVVLLGGTLLAIALSAFGFISLFMALIVLLLVLLAMKIANPKDLPKSIDYNLAIIIAMALALGTAMINTGVASMIANLITTVFKPLGNLGLLAGIYIITATLAAYITNVPAVAIIFPISLSIAAADPSLPVMPFILVVSFAAAANFMTPIGYQTNMMIYGPGGYKFTDFFKVGFPLTVIYMIVTVGILYFRYF